MSWEAWGTPEYLDYPECPRCGGTGEEADGSPCKECDGKGYREVPERMEDDVI